MRSTSSTEELGVFHIGGLNVVNNVNIDFVFLENMLNR